MDLEDFKYIAQVSTIMRLLTSKDSDLSNCFDKNGEKALDDLYHDAANDKNRGKIKGQLPLEHIFEFCKTFGKITKLLELHLIFKKNDLQDFIFMTVAADINVTINSLHLYVPILFPNSQTQVLFNESTMNNYTITFDSWYTERKISNDGRELQADIGSAQKINSPKYLIGAFQTNERTTPNKARNPSIFDINHVTKYFVEIDEVRFTKDSFLTNFRAN